MIPNTDEVWTSKWDRTATATIKFVHGDYVAALFDSKDETVLCAGESANSFVITARPTEVSS